MKNKIISALQQTFRSLHTRNFRIFFFSQLISSTGNWLTNIALTLFVLNITDSGIAVGILASCQYGPILLLSVWAGAIADRSNKRRLLLITQMIEMIQSFSLAVIAFLPDPHLGPIYVIAGIGGIALAFDNPVRRSFVTEMVSQENAPNAVVLNSALINASRIFGPTLAGVLVITVGYGWCFTIDGLSYIAVLISLLMMRQSELRPSPVIKKAKGQIREGLRYVKSVHELWIPFVMLAVIGTLSYNFGVILPLLVKHALGGGDSEFTLLYASFSVGALIAALVAAHRKTVKVNQIIYGAGAIGISMMFLSLVPNIAFAFPVVICMGISSIIYMTATTAIVQVKADRNMHGRILALQAVLLIGTTPIGGPIVGTLSDLYGPRIPIALGGIAALLSATWGFMTLRRQPNKADRKSSEPIEEMQVADSIDAAELPTYD